VRYELDENERIDAVMDYHRRAGVKLGNLKLHAITHVGARRHCAIVQRPLPIILRSGRPSLSNKMIAERTGLVLQAERQCHGLE
jgi:hypothetical protein